MWPLRSGSGAPTFVIDTFGQHGTVPNISISYASGTWPTAFKILYIPFRVPFALTILELYISNGGVVSGNFDIGIYTLDGVLLVNTGSIVQTTISVVQAVAITNTVIGPGAFYLGLQMSSVTATLTRGAPLIQQVQAYGVLMQTAGALGLPAVATFATPVDAFLPSIGLATTVNF